MKAMTENDLRVLEDYFRPWPEGGLYVDGVKAAEVTRVVAELRRARKELESARQVVREDVEELRRLRAPQ